MNNTIIITGCSGYIGSHAVIYFKKLGYEIIGCDIKLPLPCVLECLSCFYPCEFSNDIFIDKINTYTNPIIIHMAGSSSVKYSFENPEYFYKTNFDDLKYFLGKINNSMFVFPSSCYVYESNDFIGSNEIYNPKTPYGISKLQSEDLLQLFQYKHNIIISRLFNVYGCYEELLPVMHKTQLIPTLINSELNNTLFYIPINNSGIRDFVFLNQIFEAISYQFYSYNTYLKTLVFSNFEGLSIHQLVNLYEDLFNCKLNTYCVDNIEDNYSFRKKNFGYGDAALLLKDNLPKLREIMKNNNFS